MLRQASMPNSTGDTIHPSVQVSILPLSSFQENHMPLGPHDVARYVTIVLSNIPSFLLLRTRTAWATGVGSNFNIGGPNVAVCLLGGSGGMLPRKVFF